MNVLTSVVDEPFGCNVLVTPRRAVELFENLFEFLDDPSALGNPFTYHLLKQLGSRAVYGLRSRIFNSLPVNKLLDSFPGRREAIKYFPLNGVLGKRTHPVNRDDQELKWRGEILFAPCGCANRQDALPAVSIREATCKRYPGGNRWLPAEG